MVMLTLSVLNLRLHLPPLAHIIPTEAVVPSFVPVSAVLHRRSSDLDSLTCFVERFFLEASTLCIGCLFGLFVPAVP